MSEGLKQTIPTQIVKYSYYNLRDVTIKQLTDAQIIEKGNYASILTRKPDGLVIHNKKVLAVIEYKSTTEFNTEDKRKKAIEQSLVIAKGLNCKIFIATDSHTSVWVNALNGERILDENGRQFNEIFDYKKVGGNFEFERNVDRISASLTKQNSQIQKNKALDPYQLAKKLWQKIWINTGKEPEKCLYNVVELFIFKFLSDLGVLKPELQQDFSSVYKLSLSSPDAALKMYASVIRKKIKELFPKGSDNTTIINGTIFVTETGEPNTTQARLFSELLSDFYAYELEYGTFRTIDKNFKTKLFESFLKQSAGIKRLGQFFTPRKIVQAIIGMSEIETLRNGAKICDPFCGVGGFVLEAMNMNKGIQNQFKPTPGKTSIKIPLKGFDQGTDEKEDERTIILAKANMLIYLSEIIAEYHTESDIKLFSTCINDTFELIRDNLGTLKMVNEPGKGYDLILSNPPYVSKGAKSVKDEIISRGLSEFYTFGGTGIEGQCLEWIVRNLNPKGQAVVVIPDSTLRRSSDSSLREAIMNHCYIDFIASLPSRTFYATSKKTYILGVTKKEDLSDIQTDPIFMYIVREIGESRDANRIDTPDKNDLDSMVSQYRQFKGNRQAFSTKDELCKVIEFDTLAESSNWIIESFWTREEKEKIKIAEENKVLSFDEFSSLVKDLTANIHEIESDLALDLSKIKFKNIQLGDEEFFQPITSLLGYTQKEYIPLDTKNPDDYPVFTAQKDAVAYVKKIEKRDVISCSPQHPHISIASDGDGTAGTNIILHTRDYYLNTSRISYKLVHSEIDPSYVFHSLQGIKQEYGFNYSHKATLQNQQDVSIAVPLSKKGDFDLVLQRDIASRYKKAEETKSKLKEALLEIVNSKISIK